MVRSACYEKNSVKIKSGVWIAEEDTKTPTFVLEHGSSNWTSIPKKTGVKRCGKSCRLRWNNYMPDLKHDNFTSQEEDLIIKLHAAIGSRWSIIAQQLPGRTDNDVKNNWNTKLKKKLSQMGIDPVTHKPFSKLIADYGNIGTSFHKPTTQIEVANKDFRNYAILLKSDPYQFNQQQTLQTTGNSSFMVTKSHSDDDFSIVKGDSNCTNIKNETNPTLVDAFPPFSWNDFLLEDAFAPPTNNQEQQILFSKENVMSQNGKMKEAMSHQVSSCSDISFVEAILDQENEMFLSFPHLLEEPSNY